MNKDTLDRVLAQAQAGPPGPARGTFDYVELLREKAIFIQEIADNLNELVRGNATPPRPATPRPCGLNAELSDLLGTLEAIRDDLSVTRSCMCRQG